MTWTEIGPEVLVAGRPIVTLTSDDIVDLKERASRNIRRRIRVCAHQNVNDPVHEMLIVMARGCYIRPHRHVGKSESFHIIEGAIDLVVFDDVGVVTEIVRLGDYSSGDPFYYRGQGDVYHTVRVRSEYAVFHESTNGPFRREDSPAAPWSPEEADSAGVADFLARLGLGAP